jgi:hypothetical protein
VLRFIGCATKPTDDEDSVGHVSRSSNLLRLEASRDRIFQSGLNTSADAAWMMPDDACDIIVEGHVLLKLETYGSM